MTTSTLHYIILFIVLVLAQAILFNHICLFGVAVPLVFIYLLIKLPVSVSVNLTMTVGFLLGMSVDIFSDTQGMNALACTILAAMRKPIMHLYTPREDEMSNPVPSSKSMGEGAFFKYALTMTVVYCLLFFLIEAFSFFNPGRLLAKIVTSSALTFVIILAINAISGVGRHEKRL